MSDRKMGIRSFANSLDKEVKILALRKTFFPILRVSHTSLKMFLMVMMNQAKKTSKKKEKATKS